MRTFSEQIFEQLFNQYKSKFILIANSYVRDIKTAEDIVHDSFMIVWENRENILGENLEAYIYKIIRNNCLMYRRHQQIGLRVYENIKVKEQNMMDYYTHAIESTNPDTLFQHEIMNIYRHELELMPPLRQHIFRARKAEGKSYREIADELDIPIKKVDKELQSAVSRLRTALKDFLALCLVFRYIDQHLS